MSNFTKKLTFALIVLIIGNLKWAQADDAVTEPECFEKVSRGVFKFNQGFDNIVLEPVAKVYNKLPEPIKNGTGNFTSNLANLLSIPNHLLQGDLKSAGNSTASFLINSTIGIFGLGDPASLMGIKSTKEDVGQTLGRYGFGGGCYYVLPFLGPTTLRDTLGMAADSIIDPFAHVTLREKELKGISGNRFDYFGVKGADVVDFRADNILNFESLEKNSIDLYSAQKSIYLQSRLKKIQNSDLENDQDWDDLEK